MSIPVAAFPTGYDETQAESIDVPRAIIPLLAALIAMWEYRDSWPSDADYEQGYQAALYLQDELAKGMP